MANTKQEPRMRKTFPHPFIIGRSSASKEIDHAKLMGEKNIGPKVHRTKKTLFKSSMNMNNMNGTVGNAIGRNRKIELSKEDMKKIIKLVLKMHKEGYYHGRIFSKKVMWKQLEDGKNFKLIGFKKLGKIEDKLDYKDALSIIKSKPDEIYWMMSTQKNHTGDLIALYHTLRVVSMSQYNLEHQYNDFYDGDFYYDLMKENEHLYKFSKWFRETAETEVKKLNNKNRNKKRNNNKN